MMIVNALKTSATQTVPTVPCSALKAFWSSELDRLKQDSITWHNIWKNAGSPSSGIIQAIKTTCKLKYKIAIKEAYLKFEYANCDKLSMHFANKKMPEFWKSWNKKFGNNVAKKICLNGCSDDADVANIFADYFSMVYYDSNNNVEAKSIYHKDFDEARMIDGLKQDQCLSAISVELIDKCIRNLKTGKACGPDNISAEHLQYAHPSIVVHLKLLFQ
jgi:hypothetical protein